MLQGVGVSPGVGIGRAVVIAEGSLDYTQVHFAGVQQEKARLRTAVQAFAQRTQAMADALRARLDGQEADILASQILMANDPALLAQTDSRIEAGECAEAALDAVCASYIQLFAAAGDELLAQRAADIEDIRARLLAILLGRSEASIPDVPPGTVLIAWDLTPSMTVSVNRENVAAFVAECGGMTSHAAILARALGLPAVLGAAGAASVLRSGEDVVVDGGQGAVIVSPSGAELARYRKKQEKEKRQAEALQAYRAGPAVSARGQRYALYANIGGRNFCLWDVHPCPRRRSSTKLMHRCPALWGTGPRLSVRWISAATRRCRIWDRKRRRILTWAAGASATALPGLRCSARSFGRCCARGRSVGTSGSCCQW